MKKSDILLTALVLNASEGRGQVVLSAELVGIAKSRVTESGSVLITERDDGSIVVGLAKMNERGFETTGQISPSSSLE